MDKTDKMDFNHWCAIIKNVEIICAIHSKNNLSWLAVIKALKNGAYFSCLKKALSQQDMASRLVCDASPSCTPHPVNMCLTARSLAQEDTMALQQPWHCEQCTLLPLWLPLLVSHQSYIEHVSVLLVCLHEAKMNKTLAISFLVSALQEPPSPKGHLQERLQGLTESLLQGWSDQKTPGWGLRFTCC